MWHEIDWGWGIAFHMPLWWLLIALGLLVVIGWVLLLLPFDKPAKRGKGSLE